MNFYDGLAIGLIVGATIVATAVYFAHKQD